jgi:copper transport protein
MHRFGFGAAGALLAAIAAALAAPASASAHAELVHTTPTAGIVVKPPPTHVSLAFTEPVEPRFATISVRDAGGTAQTAGRPRRSETSPDTLVVPLRRVSPGWYLVFWRVVSTDGHPTRGSFTFAVGPHPGAAPTFSVPSTSETVATPGLVTARTVMFLALMAAIGLFVIRIAIARPVVARVAGARLRATSIAFVVASAIALIVIPVYVELATAEFAERSVFALRAVIPLLRASAFGRGYLDLEVAFALFVLAAAVAIALDRPQLERRSNVERIAVVGAFGAAAAVLLAPGASGHAGQTSPRGVALAFDWLHIAAGSLWVGGLLGLLVLSQSVPVAQRIAALAVCVPRFSDTAFVSVLALIGSGVGAAVLHLPTFASLWQTSYGKTILIKAGLLAAAVMLAAVHLLRTRPRLLASEPQPKIAARAARLLRRRVPGELLLIGGAVAAAAVLSSLPPPPQALAEAGRANARVGPGPARTVLEKDGYRLETAISPNRVGAANTFTLRITKGGAPVRGADVTTSFAMLDMEMPQQAYRLREIRAGVYERSAPALGMVGRWGLSFEIAPEGAPPFNILVVDRATG